MTEELEKYESNIKKKHSIHWTPRFREEFHTGFTKKIFLAIALKTFEKLKWDIVFEWKNSVEAEANASWTNRTEQVSAVYEDGKVKVKSVSLGSEMWDNGRNSKRVKLFIYAFQQIEKEYDKEAISELEKEIDAANNWDDYEIPNSLVPPKTIREPQFWILLLRGMIAALSIEFLVASFSIKTGYFIGLHELGVALIIGFVLKILIKKSNYTSYDQLHRLLIGMIVITYLTNQYFQFKIILNTNDLQNFSFWEFMQVRFDSGLKIKSINTGSVGLVVSWVLQLALTYLIGSIRLNSVLSAYLIKRVPLEVSDFAMFHLIRGKTEPQVKIELSKMGWTELQSQKEVFEAIEAIQEGQGFRRTE